MQYEIYFQIGTKKLKHVIDAYSREDAIKRLKDKIVIHKVEEVLEEEPDYDLPPEHHRDVEYLKSIFGIK